MMFIEISIGGAPLRPFEGAARNSSVQWRAFRKSGYPVLRKEYAQLNELEHFLKANRIPLCLKMLAARIWASYTAKRARCHPSVLLFGGFCLFLAAQRSGR